MAFPTVAGSASNFDSSAPRTVTLPASIAAGDLIISAVQYVLGATPSTPAGYSVLVTGAISAEVGLVVYYKIAAGGETSIDPNLSAHFLNAISVRITGWHGTTPPEAAVTGNAASSASPNPPSLTPSWGSEDTLWLAVGVMMVDGTATFTGVPTNYTSIVTSQNGGEYCGISMGQRNLAATSEDPGAFSDSVTVEAWRAATIAIRPAAGSTSYSIAADVGAYTLSGQDALRKLTMGAGLGNYVLSGQDARKLQTMVASVGTYSLTGNDVNLVKNVPLTAELGAYVLSGQPVADPGSTYTLTADPATYTLDGVASGLLRGLSLAGGAGAYDLVGQDALRANTYKLTGDVGAYLLQGQDTTGDYTYRLGAEAGDYALSGIAAALLHGYTLPAGVGSYVFTGVDVAFLKGYTIAASVGEYTLEGQEVRDAFEAFTMEALQGTYDITGVDVTLRKQARRLWVHQDEASDSWSEEAPRARRNVH